MARLARAIGEAHRRYTRRVNFREGWRGHLWQGRFASFPMDEEHLCRAGRYVELNPVRARLVRAPWRYRWSSAAAHLKEEDDRLVRVAPMLERVDDWREFLADGLHADEAEQFRRHERSGRPMGSADFVARLEALLGRVLRPCKRGPKGPRRRGRRARLNMVSPELIALAGHVGRRKGQAREKPSPTLYGTPLPREHHSAGRVLPRDGLFSTTAVGTV